MEVARSETLRVNNKAIYILKLGGTSIQVSVITLVRKHSAYLPYSLSFLEELWDKTLVFNLELVYNVGNVVSKPNYIPQNAFSFTLRY